MPYFYIFSKLDMHLLSILGVWCYSWDLTMLKCFDNLRATYSGLKYSGNICVIFIPLQPTEFGHSENHGIFDFEYKAFSIGRSCHSDNKYIFVMCLKVKSVRVFDFLSFSSLFGMEEVNDKHSFKWLHCGAMRVHSWGSRSHFGSSRGSGATNSSCIRSWGVWLMMH